MPSSARCVGNGITMIVWVLNLVYLSEHSHVTCRKISSNVNSMAASMSTIADTMTDIKNIIKSLTDVVADVKQTCEATKVQLTDLQGKYNALKTENEQWRHEI